MEIKKFKDLPWDENRVGIRNGWAVGQAVQITVAFSDDADVQEKKIKDWTQWFLTYAEELRDEQADIYNASHTQYKPATATNHPQVLSPTGKAPIHT